MTQTKKTAFEKREKPKPQRNEQCLYEVLESVKLINLVCSGHWSVFTFRSTCQVVRCFLYLMFDCTSLPFFLFFFRHPAGDFKPTTSHPEGRSLYGVRIRSYYK